MDKSARSRTEFKRRNLKGRFFLSASNAGRNLEPARRKQDNSVVSIPVFVFIA